MTLRWSPTGTLSWTHPYPRSRGRTKALSLQGRVERSGEFTQKRVGHGLTEDCVGRSWEGDSAGSSGHSSP